MAVYLARCLAPLLVCSFSILSRDCSIAKTLKPDSSALFVLVRKAQPEKVLVELSRFRGQVLRSSLSPEQEARLQEALSASSLAPGSSAPA